MSDAALRAAGGVNDALGEATDATIAVVVVTHNRVDVLRECVENVLFGASPKTTEIVVWNNASNDGTAAYLDALAEPRLTVVHHPTNIGLNAYEEAFKRTSASHLIELDDDVVGAPSHWDLTLLRAFERIPLIGFLSADLAKNEEDIPSRLRHQDWAHLYTDEVVNGIHLLNGPTGGACAMTSRSVYARAGGFPQHRRRAFFQEDAEFIVRIERLGYRKAILADLCVRHMRGPYHGGASPKDEFWKSYWRTARRRNQMKRALLRLPLVPTLNSRFGWFGPLEWEETRAPGGT